MKKFLAQILTLCLVGAFFVGAAHAEVTGLSGSGTQADPYIVSNLDELKWLRDSVNGASLSADDGNDYSGKYIKLTADIDLGNEEWIPIGYKSNDVFNGKFDGGNFTVSNLKITKGTENIGDNNRLGLFGKMTSSSAYIKNLTVENVDITGSWYVAAIVGDAYLGTIDNCHVKGDLAIDCLWDAGFISGEGYATVSNCTVVGNDGSYISSVDAGNVGGIWGYRGEGNCPITNCSVTNVNVGANYGAGGIVGLLHYGNKLSNCSVTDVNVAILDTDNDSNGTAGLLAGFCHGTTSSPCVIDSSNTCTNSVAYNKGEPTLALFGNNMNGGVPVTNLKAQVGTVGYATLEAALAAANDGDTVTLLGDVALTAPVTVASDVTIDLNHKTLTTSQAVAVEADVTVKGIGNVTAESVGFEVASGAKLAITGGTYSAGDELFSAEGDVSVSGGTFDSEVPEEFWADGIVLEKNDDGSYGARAHNISADWTCDADNHWHECGDCDEQADKAAHAFGDWYTGASGKHQRACSTCGYVETGAPATGDIAPIALYMVMLAASAAAFVAICRKKIFG